MISILRWIILIAWLGWVAVYWRVGQRAVADIARSKQNADVLDTRLMQTIMVMMVVIGLSAMLITMGVISADRLGEGPIVFGSALTLIGMIGTFYCRHYLGRFWTAETTLKSDHQIIDRGPYGIVRHPIYTCACLMFLGTALVYFVWWVVAACGVVIVAYGLKANHEDLFLAQNLTGYAGYQQRVRRRLIPGVW